MRRQAHTNGIESFWSMLKRAHKGTFHKISPKHLNRYCQVNRNSLFSGSKSILAIVENQRLSWHVNQWNLQ